MINREIPALHLVYNVKRYDALTERHKNTVLVVGAFSTCAGSDAFQNQSGKVLGMSMSERISPLNCSGVQPRHV